MREDMPVIIYAGKTILKDELSVFNLIYSTKIKRKGEETPGLNGLVLFCGRRFLMPTNQLSSSPLFMPFLYLIKPERRGVHPSEHFNWKS